MRDRNSASAVGGQGTLRSIPATSQLEQLTALATTLRRNGDLNGAARAFSQIADVLPDDWLAQYNAGVVLLEANLLRASIVRLESALALHASARTYTIYAHVLALNGDNAKARSAYEQALRLAPRDIDAHWGLFELTQLLDDNAAALHHQQIALEERSIVSIAAKVAPARVTILELCIAGTFQANIPLDFILDRETISVHKLYVGVHPIPALPHYDIVFNTIADAPNAKSALDVAARFIIEQDRPALNLPELVPLTSRDSIATIFADSRTVAVAQTARVTRASIGKRQPAFPFLIRPLDSHAGNDLAKIEDADGLNAYLASTVEPAEFFVSAFIDYRNPDGYFRKYRIVFVAGTPYPVHLAISPRWMIHYYNAEMENNAWMRDEEHAFMRDMDSVFNGVLADGLRDIADALALDYFGIDCSVAPDGRVLLFEASTAMIVHLRDPVDLYPYKAQYIPRIIRALERLFDERIAAGMHR